MALEKVLQTVAFGPSLALGLLLEIKFYCDTVTVIHLAIVYGCFHILQAQLSSLAHKAENIYYQALNRQPGEPLPRDMLLNLFLTNKKLADFAIPSSVMRIMMIVKHL